MSNYKDLIVWKKSIDLTKVLYEVIGKFPNTELFGLSSQMKRAAISIPSNIAEGYGRNGILEYKQFLGISKGSSFELETQIILGKELGFINNNDFEKLYGLN